jgi:hypothetical protein
VSRRFSRRWSACVRCKPAAPAPSA